MLMIQPFTDHYPFQVHHIYCRGKASIMEKVVIGDPKGGIGLSTNESGLTLKVKEIKKKT